MYITSCIIGLWEKTWSFIGQYEHIEIMQFLKLVMLVQLILLL